MKFIQRLVFFCFISFLWMSCGATTIVTVISPGGIVICSDGKAVIRSSKQGAPQRDAGIPSKKLYAINGRFVLSQVGLVTFQDQNFPAKSSSIRYSVVNVVSELTRRVSTIQSMESIGRLTNNILSEQFQGLQSALNSGSFARDNATPANGFLTEVTIAGFDGGSPRVYGIPVVVDWRALTYKIGPPRLDYPDRRKNITILIGGSNNGILALRDTKSAAYAAALKALPVEIPAMISDQPLSLPQMATLARYLVGLQVLIDPANVGYPITVITMQAGGKITERTYQK